MSHMSPHTPTNPGEPVAVDPFFNILIWVIFISVMLIVLAILISKE